MTDANFLASSYRLTALLFWDCAKEVNKVLEKDTDGRPIRLSAIPFYFLVSHATELLLKAALLNRGFSNQKLKSFDYRHNLDKLLEELHKMQIGLTKDSTDLIISLNEQHQTHSLRYTVLVANGKSIFWPPSHFVFAMLNELSELSAISI